LLKAVLWGDAKAAALLLKVSAKGSDPFRWADVVNSPFRLSESKLDFAESHTNHTLFDTKTILSGCTYLIEFAVLSQVRETPRIVGKGRDQKKVYYSINDRTEESRKPLLQLLVERGANPHPGIEKAEEAGYGSIVKMLKESSIDPLYGWDTLEAMRRIYAEVGKPKTNAEIKADLAAAATGSVVRLLKNANGSRATRKRSGSNSNNSKSKSKSKSNNSKSKTPRGGAGGED
jgi:hypothetical protein